MLLLKCVMSSNNGSKFLIANTSLLHKIALKIQDGWLLLVNLV